ncbi:MAG: VOC family protein [Acidimicrobiia bacterium]
MDCADPHRLADFWQAAIGFSTRVGDGTPYITLSGADGDKVMNHLTLQKVPEAKVAKHRLHLDLFVSDRPATVARLQGLGATVLSDPDGAEGHLGFVATVMADPEGGEFCVVSKS